MLIFSEIAYPSFTPTILKTLLLIISIIKDLGIYLRPTLSFDHHINLMDGKAFKIMRFIRRNTEHFFFYLLSSYPLFLLSSLHFRIWSSNLTYYKLCIEGVQNWFLSFGAFILKIKHPMHNYSLVSSILGIISSVTRRIKADFHFIVAS